MADQSTVDLVDVTHGPATAHPVVAAGPDAPDLPPADAVRDARSGRFVALLVAARILALAYLVFSNQHLVVGGIAGDVHRYVEMATAQGTPYRDFQIEYPPVTFALIWVLSRGGLGIAIPLVALSQFVCDLGVARLLEWGWGRRASLAYLALGLPLIAYPFIYVRIDLFSVLLTVAALACIRRRRNLRGGALLGVAVLAKIWPFAVAPVLIVERRVKGVAALALSGVALTAAWCVVGGFAGPQQVLSFRDATGWQVESLPGILWHLRDPSRIKFESGAFRTGIMPLWARPTLTLISLGFIVGAWAVAGRRRRAGADDHVVYALAPLVCVLSLLIFAPILSPQYVMWMLPFAALIAARGDRLIIRMTAGITAITTLSYVFVPAAAEGALYGTLPVLLRNLALVALFVVAWQLLLGARPTAPDGAEVVGSDPALLAEVQVEPEGGDDHRRDRDPEPVLPVQ